MIISVSKSYFDKAKCILGIEQLSDLNELMEAYKADKRKAPRWEHQSFSPSMLLGYDQLATKP